MSIGAGTVNELYITMLGNMVIDVTRQQYLGSHDETTE